jgi:hypothetical protein
VDAVELLGAIAGEDARAPAAAATRKTWPLLMASTLCRGSPGRIDEIPNLAPP